MNIVIIDCFDTWEHRVDLLHKIFSELGHNVKCLLSDYRHFEKMYRYDKKKDFIFFHAKSYKKNISIQRMLSHIFLSRDFFSYVTKNINDIDLLWVLAPPNIFIRDASRVKKRYSHLKLIIDIIDLWPESMPIKRGKKILFLWRYLRNKYLKYADYVVTECNLYQTILSNVLKNLNVMTLYLARENKGYKPNIILPNNNISLCYLGSINNIIDINGIANVVNICQKKMNTVLHIIGNGEKKNVLKNKIIELGAAVVDHGEIYDRIDKQKIFDSCHYGINMMKDSVGVGLTMKSIDYFEFGLPIINNIHGDTWDIIEKYNCGYNFDIAFRNKNFYYTSIKIRNNCRKFFESFLSEENFRMEIIKLLQKLGENDYKIKR